MKIFIYKLMLLVSITAVLQANYFDTNQANVWSAKEGEEGFRSYALDYGYAWSSEVNKGEESFSVTDSFGYSELIIPNTDQTFFLLNNFNNSYPSVNSNYVRFSLSGLSEPNSDPSSMTAPTVELIPGDTYNLNETTALHFIVQKGDGNDNPLTLHYKIDSSAEATKLYSMSFDNPEDFEDNATIYLIRNADYNISFILTQGSENSPEYMQHYTLYNEEGFRRDSDGDGFPDLWEAKHGLNPLVDSRQVDSDGDGWSDADEALRGSDPFDANFSPTDSDGDGWSDYDEQVRFTDYNESSLPTCSERPTATSLYGAEYNITGEIVSPAAYNFDVLTLSGEQRFDSANPNAYFDHNITGKPDCNLSMSAINSNLNVEKIPQVRFSASSEMVASAQVSKDEAGNKILKSYLPNRADVDIAQVTPWLEDQDKAWQSVKEWEDGVKAYLSSHLVYGYDFNVTQDSSVDVSVLEASLAYFEALDYQNRSLTLFGQSRHRSEMTAHWLEHIRAHRVSVNDLYRDIELMHASDNEDLKKVFYGLGNILSSYASSDKDSDVLLAESVQRRDWHNDYFVYVLKLISYIPFQNSETDPFNLNYDSDGDGITNYDELMLVDGSNPFDADSDDDGLDDALDPCKLSANNDCLSQENSDSDGDGILDGFDNCPNMSNVAQADSNNNGVGEACELDSAYVITWPRNSISIVLGDSITFKLQATALAASESVSDGDVLWSDNGTTLESALEPSEWNFDLGTHNVCVDITLAASTLHQCRVVSVEGSSDILPTVSFDGSAEITERTGGDNRTLLIELTREGSLDQASSFGFITHFDDLIAPASPADLGMLSGEVHFSPQQLHAYIRLEIVSDTIREADEKFSVSFVNPVGIKAFSYDEVNVTIMDDELDPYISFADPQASINEESGIYSVDINLSSVSTLSISGDVVVSSATATPEVDFNLSGGFTINPGENTAHVELTLIDDMEFEDTEKLELSLSNLSNAQVGIYDYTALDIIDDDAKSYAMAINDSNVLTCASDTNNSASCSLSGFLGQDATHGRDVVLPDDSDGLNGFSFVKMDSSGVPLSDQSGNGVCVEDNTTKLLWSVPTSGEYTTTYTWYDTNVSTNGGYDGSGKNGPTTKDIVDTKNAALLCGKSHWRLPTRTELFDLMSLDNGAYIQSEFFPNINTGGYWTADTVIGSNSLAYSIDLSNWGFVQADKATEQKSVILVHDYEE